MKVLVSLISTSVTAQRHDHMVMIRNPLFITFACNKIWTSLLYCWSFPFILLISSAILQFRLIESGKKLGNNQDKYRNYNIFNISCKAF